MQLTTSILLCALVLTVTHIVHIHGAAIDENSLNKSLLKITDDQSLIEADGDINLVRQKRQVGVAIGIGAAVAGVPRVYRVAIAGTKRVFKKIRKGRDLKEIKESKRG